MLPISIYAINRFIYARLPFDPDRDLVPATLVWDFPNVAVVPAQHVPSRTLAEFTAWAKARNGGISYGSPGVGSPHHLTMERLSKETGVRFSHAPHRGASPALTSRWSRPAACGRT